MDKLEEQEFDEWTGIQLGGTCYDVNVWPDEHGNLRVAIYPLIDKDNSLTCQTDTLNPVATGTLDILDLKRIKEGI